MMNGDYMAYAIDLSGEKVGKLLVLERVTDATRKDRHAMWRCVCDCGNETVVASNDLRLQRTTSCGCVGKEKTSERMRYLRFTHGLTINGNKDRLYSIWYNMKRRCYYEKSPSYKYYGARGITVCDEWIHDYASFHNWAINNGYDDSLTLDRIDNYKGYSPDNCRWATYKEQAANKRKAAQAGKG